MIALRHDFYELAAALAIGLLIGLERGWSAREAEEGERVAGLRTFGLIGLLGGVSGILAGRLGILLVGFAFLALAGVLTTAYVIDRRRGDDVGITSLVAGLLAFLFGVMAALGEVVTAAAAGVVTTLLLGFKPLLHRWVSRLEPKELHAALELLLISVVLLPVLPNRGMGPWQALNPYAIWWMVVLIAAISFTGYFAFKIAGARKGALLTGFFAGLASSTALTLHFARLARANATLVPMLGTGILVACGTMFPRMVLVTGLINGALLRPLLLPAAIMAVVVYGSGLLYWSRAGRQLEAGAPLENPLELRSAVTFGALLALVMVLAQALERWLGEAGILLLAALSGVADVDAITLSLARMSQSDLAAPIAVTGMIIAAAVNSVIKGTMAASVGGRQLGLRVALPLLGSAVAGLLTVWWRLW